MFLPNAIWASALKSRAKTLMMLRSDWILADDAEIAGNYPVAIVEFRVACKMVDSGPNRARLGKVLIKIGKAVDGFAELRDSLRKDWPTDQAARGSSRCSSIAR